MMHLGWSYMSLNVGLKTNSWNKIILNKSPIHYQFNILPFLNQRLNLSITFANNLQHANNNPKRKKITFLLYSLSGYKVCGIGPSIVVNWVSKVVC